jgi:hypothetical protein
MICQASKEQWSCFAMIRRFVFRAIVGFCVPIFWGIVSFIFFTAPESVWTDRYWMLVYITCPPWLLPEITASWFEWLITPLANAILYGCVAIIILATTREFRRRFSTDPTRTERP